MYPLVKQIHTIPRTLTFFSRLLDHCHSSKSVNLTKVVHGQLIKVGFNCHTFLGNRCLELYTQCQFVDDILKAFGDIPRKNTISWNICLKGLLNCGHSEMAQSLFERIPEQDVVSWNTMISWYVSCGHSDCVWEKFREMQYMGVKPSGYTYSIVASLVFDAILGKELHGKMIRSGLIRSNLVLGNSLIDMYGKIGLIDYAVGVFLSMEHLDLISWNSLIVGCCKAGFGELALNQFSSMRYLGFPPDEFTCSAVITCCTNLRNLEKGKQIFALCIKVGFLSNSIISSAIIDLFSKCNRLEHSVQLFKDLDRHNSADCNSMISGYTSHDISESAIQLLMVMLKEDIRPTEFTLSSILSSISGMEVVQGTHIHSLVVKIGFEIDCVVCSSLVHMYATLGLIDCATKIFASMTSPDLISWNTMIMGLTLNGRLVKAIDTFNELHRRGPLPDQISLTGVLRACSYGGFVDEGIVIFSKMEEYYGVRPCNEHYACLVDLLCQDGRLYDAMEIIELMPYEPSSMIWELLLHACASHGDVRLAEKVGVRLMELEPHLSLPYVILGRVYEIRGQWEDAVRVREAMKRNVSQKVVGCCCIVIKDHVYNFTGEQLQQHAGRDIYSILRLMAWEKGETMIMEINQTDTDAIANMVMVL
ncbi:pentatricopeptide repeat-containing protein At1g43980, mitochondrial-like [Chenopodium quinoa]|uniref:pentatricopeptide repeat-containing protein At1g43980, mitochondrial-like n=1 Tax=Chenopodium quinoa TaxID=63459 RepID=UPI000B770141|nr:pentatricopeptide repeat-containing protein At1g43980, mitochondrial-like [Chenopodium quinoa]